MDFAVPFLGGVLAMALLTYLVSLLLLRDGFSSADRLDGGRMFREALVAHFGTDDERELRPVEFVNEVFVEIDLEDALEVGQHE